MASTVARELQSLISLSLSYIFIVLTILVDAVGGLLQCVPSLQPFFSLLLQYFSLPAQYRFLNERRSLPQPPLER
jgi:hypothetical protein